MELCPLMFVMHLTPEQRRRFEADDVQTVSDELWDSCKQTVGTKKTQAVTHFQVYKPREDPNFPFTNAVISGCNDESDFMFLIDLGMMVATFSTALHQTMLGQHGLPTGTGILVNMEDDEAMAHSGWLLRRKLGKIDLDTGIYDGENKTGVLSPARHREILEDAENYAVCLVQLGGDSE